MRQLDQYECMFVGLHADAMQREHDENPPKAERVGRHRKPEWMRPRRFKNKG